VSERRRKNTIAVLEWSDSDKRIYRASIIIRASPADIWAVLIDVSRWPEWDSNFDKMEGEVALGQRLKIFSKVMAGRVVSVTVTQLVQNQKMTLTSRMPLGLFKGQHSYTLTAKGDGTTEVLSYEFFTGPLLPLIGKSIPDMTQSFNEFVSRLKQRVEAHQ